MSSEKNVSRSFMEDAINAAKAYEAAQAAKNSAQNANSPSTSTGQSSANKAVADKEGKFKTPHQKN